MARFHPGVRMTLLLVVLVPVAVALGFWQLDRAAEKRALENARLASYGALPLSEQALPALEEFARVRLVGHYDAAHQFYVDNHTRHGVPGYLVVTPFVTVGGRQVLANRGWVAAPVERDVLPEIATPMEQVSVEGVRWPDTRAAVGPSTDAWPANWPKRVQYLDPTRMADSLSGALPVEVRIDEGQPGSFAPIVIGDEMTPARHMGYAVQWFALAIALAIWWLVSGFRRGD
jgi:cytochrome oxidase assembly protein ShyY1